MRAILTLLAHGFRSSPLVEQPLCLDLPLSFFFSSQGRGTKVPGLSMRAPHLIAPVCNLSGALPETFYAHYPKAPHKVYRNRLDGGFFFLLGFHKFFHIRVKFVLQGLRGFLCELEHLCLISRSVFCHEFLQCFLHLLALLPRISTCSFRFDGLSFCELGRIKKTKSCNLTLCCRSFWFWRHGCGSTIISWILCRVRFSLLIRLVGKFFLNPSIFFLRSEDLAL